jgi:hypothetical protein
MSPTLHRPPTGNETPHRFEFLHGIDLERVHIRSPRSSRRWFGAGIMVLIVLAASAVLLTVTQGPEPAPDALDTQIATAHDSGIAQAVQAHEAELEAAHDSGIAQAVQAHEAELGAAHDSGIAQAVQAHEAELEAAHDSGIAQAIRDRNAELSAVHDSGIQQLDR